MAKVNFLHFVPRPKPRKRPGVHKKNLINQKKDHIKNTIDKEDNYGNYSR